MKKRFLERVCLRYQFLAMSLVLAAMLMLSGCAVPMRRVVAQQQQPVGSISRIAVLVSDRRDCHKAYLRNSRLSKPTSIR